MSVVVAAQALDAFPLPAWSCDTAGNGLASNHAYRTFTGRDDADGAFDWRADVHPDDVSRALETFDRLSGHGAAVDVRLRAADGRWRRTRVSCAPGPDVDSVTCIGTDISDCTTDAADTPEEDRLLRAIFDNLPAFIFVKDALNNILSTNRFGAEFFGKTSEQLIGNCAYDLYPSEIAHEWHVQDLRVIESREPTLGIVSTYENAGETKWYKMDKFPLHDARNGETLVAAIGTDITGLKGIERRLREQIEDSEALVRILREREYEQNLILDNIPVMIGYKDTNNRILRANRFAAESIGLRTSEIYGKHASTIFPAEAQALHRHDLEVIRTRKPKLDIIQPLTLRTGEVRWYRMHVLPHLFTGGDLTGIVFVAEDITALRTLEEELAGT